MHKDYYFQPSGIYVFLYRYRWVEVRIHYYLTTSLSRLENNVEINV